MRKLCISILFMAVFLLSPLPVFADYLDEYVAPARYQIQMDTETNRPDIEPVGSESGNKSRNRYAAYLEVVEKCIEQFGDTDFCEGPSFGMNHFTGLSFLKLIDFNADGIEELFMVFHVRTNDISEEYENHVYVYNVWGYDGKKAVLLQDGNYLYGYDGGSQAVYFVKNPFGTFFLHGVADSFQYDYYYGYEGDKFGLAKSLLRDEQYDASGNMSIVYSVDDKNVSEEEYKEEAALWKPASEANENYVLTYYNTEERDKVWDLIDDTCKFLQQHSEELAITREKGKTILNVQFHQAQKNPPVYSLIQKDNDSGKKKTIALVQPPTEGAPEEDQEYTLSYDFSTDLQLESGSYQFYLLEEGADDDAEPFVVVNYQYDEGEKIPEDDQYGNEREFRRLLSKAIKENQALSSNEELRNNITQRMETFGLPRETAESIARTALAESGSFGKSFLYVFYKYSLGIDDNSGVPLFSWSGNRINFPREFINEIRTGKIKNEAVTAAFFHEAGHALDHNALADVPQDSSYQETMQDGSVMEALYEDAMDIVEIDLRVWAKEKDALGKPKRSIPEAAFDRTNPESLLSKVGGAILNADHIEGESLQTLTITDPPGFSEEELDAYHSVLYTMTGSIISFWGDGFWDKADYAQVMAVDVLGGMTNNKIFVPKGFWQKLQNDLVPIAYGHGRGFGNNYYWYDKSGSRSWKIPTEALAEYYSTVMTKNADNLYINQEYFTKTCQVLSDRITVIEERLRDQF